MATKRKFYMIREYCLCKAILGEFICKREDHGLKSHGYCKTCFKSEMAAMKSGKGVKMSAVAEKKKYTISIGPKRYVMEFDSGAVARTWAIKQAIALGMLDQPMHIEKYAEWLPAAV